MARQDAIVAVDHAAAFRPAQCRAAKLSIRLSPAGAGPYPCPSGQPDLVARSAPVRAVPCRVRPSAPESQAESSAASVRRIGPRRRLSVRHGRDVPQPPYRATTRLVTGRSGLLIVDDNADALAVRILAAREATATLDLMYYMWHDDDCGRLLAARDPCRSKARREGSHPDRRHQPAKERRALSGARRPSQH
jgi:hypothetical protein